MTNGTSFHTEQLVPNMIERLRALPLTELLPRAISEDKSLIDERDHLQRCVEIGGLLADSADTTLSLTVDLKELSAVISKIKRSFETIESQTFAAGISDQMQQIQITEPILGSPAQVHQQEPSSKSVEKHRFENIYAADDAVQIISSTTEGSVHAKNISGGARSVQCLGPLSYNSLRTAIGSRQPV